MEQTLTVQKKMKKILNQLAYLVGDWLKNKQNNSILFQLIENFINGFQQRPMLYSL